MQKANTLNSDLGDEAVARVRKNKTGVGIITFVILMLFITLTYLMFCLKQDLSEKQKVENRLEKAITRQEDRKEEIEKLKVYVQTKQYVEDMAREKLGMVYEDEIILKEEEEDE